MVADRPMTRTEYHTHKTAIEDIIALAIETHGARKVLLRALRAAFSRKPRAIRVSDLPPYLREDVGEEAFETHLVIDPMLLAHRHR